MKPLRQRRLLDYFSPDGLEQVQVKPTSGFATHPENRSPPDGRPSISPERIPTKWRTIISLEMQGHRQIDIARLIGMSLAGVGNIINDDRYREAREALLGELDREFIAMKPLAFRALRDGFDNPDSNVALRAAEMWFRGASFGGYSKDPPRDTSVSAEDVAKQLLQVHAQNVQINISPSGSEVGAGREARATPQLGDANGD